MAVEGEYPKDNGDIFYASELNKLDRKGVWAKRNASNTDFNDANDIMVMLSGTRWIAFDDSAKILYLTTDSGDNWVSKQAGIADTLDKFYVNPNNPDYITFFSITATEEAYFSENAGLTWTAITPQGDADQDFISYSIADSGRLYVIQNDGNSGEIWYSDDGGTGWTQVTGFQAHEPNATAIIASPKDDIIVYASSDGSNTFGGFTINGGGAWTEHTVVTASTPELVYAFYIDSNNYLLSSKLSAGVNTIGVSIVQWQGVNIFTGATNDWYNSVRDVFLFTSIDFVYTQRHATLPTTMFRYDDNGDLFQVPGGFVNDNKYYLGASDTEGEDRIHKSLPVSSTEQHELWTYNEA